MWRKLEKYDAKMVPTALQMILVIAAITAVLGLVVWISLTHLDAVPAAIMVTVSVLAEAVLIRDRLQNYR